MGYSPWGCKESDTTEHAHTLQIPIPGFIVGILSKPRSPTLQTPPSVPVFMCCTRQEISIAFSPSLNFHNSQRRFFIPTTAEETGSSDVTTPKILADLRLEPRADWPQGWCSLMSECGQLDIQTDRSWWHFSCFLCESASSALQSLWLFKDRAQCPKTPMDIYLCH